MYPVVSCNIPNQSNVADIPVLSNQDNILAIQIERWVCLFHTQLDLSGGFELKRFFYLLMCGIYEHNIKTICSYLDTYVKR